MEEGNCIGSGLPDANSYPRSGSVVRGRGWLEFFKVRGRNVFHITDLFSGSLNLFVETFPLALWELPEWSGQHEATGCRKYLPKIQSVVLGLTSS